jgi:Sigma-70, region 4
MSTCLRPPLSRRMRRRLAEANLAAQRRHARAEATQRRIDREVQSTAVRAQALVLRQSGATYAEIGAALGLSLERARQITRKAERLANSPRWYDGLPMRAQTFLRNAGLSELPEIEAATAIARFTRRELLAIPNFGKGAATAIVAWLAQHGLTLMKEITLKE